MTLDYGSYGIFLILGNAGFISTTVVYLDPYMQYLSGVTLVYYYGILTIT